MNTIATITPRRRIIICGKAGSFPKLATTPPAPAPRPPSAIAIEFAHRVISGERK